VGNGGKGAKGGAGRSSAELGGGSKNPVNALWDYLVCAQPSST